MTKAEAGRKGGTSTAKKYGNEYMSELARKGAQAFHKKYKLVPINLNDFLIVSRDNPDQVCPKTLNGQPVPERITS